MKNEKLEKPDQSQIDEEWQNTLDRLFCGDRIVMEKEDRRKILKDPAYVAKVLDYIKQKKEENQED